MAMVEQILGEAGYRLQIGVQHDNFRAIEEQVADFHARNVDGIICCSHTYLEFGAKIAPLFESKHPASSMVMVDRGEIFSKGKMATK